ncbi:MULTISPECIES: ABC transporter substrate-binding protein [unclassified Mesorhizobium]|uniref:ABC transporter substrate-binding protein n=1 Tax=unclassified Mesorhizobium TaxID=325217 RepID=UPI0003CF53C2|nr:MULTISPECIES: ABC transporter substrate-binding protein [unclassified Mesorhizobium]ESY49797.1 peptide ABC transporter substrate-binding protein [Mesorhizobium sp. LNJC374B00]ESY53371.1 peptide ABC transporter substrate-binding protein [Mesorhizobium sp. LNJC372A00]ESZ28424.1 peptide ABC transporter substrate-binding protein [Mesorhizobium sp. L2C067A000]WJI81640.1 ABC transporter substrate-binding protein [Mesorhizobium sp. C374B]WJI88159.1 ABC transporter substrate-binding protein [Mesorh
MTRRHFVLLLAALFPCALPVHQSVAKTLVYCTEVSPDTFDPALASGSRDASATALYNRMVEFEPGTTKVRPGLAESWEISDDGLTYTFHLRQGVKFHIVEGFTPSRDFNADDVLFTFDRQANAQNPFNNYAKRQYIYFDGIGMPDLVAGWRKLDDHTVVMTLKAPHSPMLADLAMDFASVVSKEYADKLVAEKRLLDLALKPVGTGPFQLVDYQQDAVIRYKANPDYWRGKPKIDDLVFAIATDASIRMEKLRAGECDLMPYPNPADLEAIKATPGIKVMRQEGLNTGYLAFNTLQKPFDDPRVRKAIAIAIDTQALVDVVFRGTGEVARNPLPPTSWAYDKTSPNHVFDPAAARQGLADAGVKDLHMKIWAMPVQRPYNPNAQRMAEMIQSDLAKIGVNVEVVTYEWTEYLARSKSRDRDGAMLFGFTGDNGDPDNFLSVPLGCAGVGTTNRANWCFPAFDDLLKQAAGIVDPAARAKLYSQAQTIFREQMPWVAIAHSVVSMPMREQVTGYVMDPFDHHDFSGVDIKE